MKMFMNTAAGLVLLGFCISESAVAQMQFSWEHGFPWQGISTFTLVMAVLYAGHLAQDRTSLGWRIVLFILGFPLTFIASFLVVPGSQRVLGVDLPRYELVPPDPDRPEDPDEAVQAEEARQERSETWGGVLALMLGVAIVALCAPSSHYSHRPLDGDGGNPRVAVEKTVYWGWGETPWLSYRREGVRPVSGVDGTIEPSWTSEREWRFEATPEMVLALLLLLVVVALCIRDERVRTRSIEVRTDRDSPERAA